MANVRYKEKPSEELKNRFERKIEEFLSSHKLKFRMEFWGNHLGPISSYVNGVHTEDLFLWIKRCQIEIPEIDKPLEVQLHEQGLDENMTDEYIWREAHYIQDQLYSYLEKNPGNPQDGDLYWRLWDKHPSKII